MEAVFLSIVASIMVLINCNYRGTKQGNIIPRTRPIAPIMILNLPDREPSSKLVIGIPSSPSLDGDMGKLSYSVCDFYYYLLFIIGLKAAVLQLNFPQMPPSEASK
jgi:hypothetical protein